MSEPPDVVHGSRSTYVGGCRCAPCTVANAVWQAGWRRARSAAGKLRLVNGYWVERGVGRAGDVPGEALRRSQSADDHRGEWHESADESE